MDAEAKAMLQKIVTRQIEGVMFHFDAMALYAMLGNCSMKREHLRHFKKESEAHADTVLYIIKNYHEFIDVLDAKGRVKVIIPAERPASKAECEEMCAKTMAMWLKWEQETQTLYKQAAEIMPDCKMIKYLCHDVEHELKRIGRLMK